MGWFTYEPKSTGRVSSRDLRAKLKKLCYSVSLPEDRNYDYISLKDFKELLWRSPSKGFKYVPEKRDCDDFSKIMRGWMSKKAWGTIVLLKVTIQLTKKNDKGQYKTHSVVGTIIDGELVLGEPQTGKLSTWEYRRIVSITI